ncbi:MAG: DUF4358 domain-containing protein [Clostridia bacterium]|nr:DUF4358 domain-containing protein [Clostridia bacterium]
MKLIKTALTFLLCLLFLVGCSSQKNIDNPDKIAAELKTYSNENANWVEIDKDKLSAYFGFNGEILSDFSVHINSSEEYFDIIAVFKLSDPSGKEEIIKGINFLSTYTEANYKIASDAQTNKISNKIVAEADDTIILCVIDNYGPIKTYLTKQLDAKILS